MKKRKLHLKPKKGIGQILILLALVVIPLTALVVYFSVNKTQGKQVNADTFEATACATTLDPSGQSQCGNSVGNAFDYHFCDRWTGGFCNDYRYKQTTVDTPFPNQAEDAVSLDCLSSTNAGQTSWLPYYVPTNNSDNTDVAGYQLIPFPCGISKYEHFMTRMEDGQFGMVVLRNQHPFDFAGRTGHVHFDLDMKTLERRYGRITFSPELTKVGVDDRNSVPQPDPSFEIWFRNGTFQGKLAKNGVLTDLFPPCNGCGSRYYGADNVRDHLDIYLSRTHVKIVVNNKTQVDQDIADIGFDRAYIYLQHVNYNSCKAFDVEHYATVAECQLAGNMFHWDNIAYDGPSLPINSLTPAGYEDVVFNVWGQASCSVKGVPAKGSGRNYVWQTWVARLGANTPVSASDVVCSGGSNSGAQWYQGSPQGLEIVQAGAVAPAPSTAPIPVASPTPTIAPTASPVLASPSPTATPIGGGLPVSTPISTPIVVPTPTSTPVPAPAPSPSPVPPPATDGITITSPLAGAPVSGTVKIGALSINGSGVSTIDYLIDGKSIGQDTISPFDIFWNTTSYTNGNHNIAIKSVTPVGYTNSITVNINNPVSALGTFGNPSIGSYWDIYDSNYMNGSSFPVGSANRSLSSMSVYVGNLDAAPYNRYQMAVYTDHHGRPDRLVAKTDLGTLKANSWNTLPVAATLLANQNYWLMYNTNGRNGFVNNMKFNTGGLDAYSKSSSSFGLYPLTFGTSVVGNLKFSIYATYK